MEIGSRRCSGLLLLQIMILVAVQSLYADQGPGIHPKNTQDLLSCISGIREFRYDSLNRLVGGSGFSRVLDPFDNILREDFANGLWIESEYDELDRPTQRRLSDGSQIHYEYRGPFLKKVHRINQDGGITYSHAYEDYDQRSNPGQEIGYFISLYMYDNMGRRIAQHNPYYQEAVEYDALGNIIRKGDIFYTYDVLSQMTSESGHFTAKYDHRYNLQEINRITIQTNSLNQINGLAYDLNGNLLRPGFVYDCFDQLIEAAGEKYVYDSLGHRLSKGHVSFLYVGEEEVASFENGKCKELKVLGLRDPIAIEIEGKAFFPVCDVQGTIRLLIDPEHPKTPILNNCDAFGANVNWMIPYAYVGKRYDLETGFYYFGKRYYDPLIRKWITPDPLGPIDDSNLYQYVFNNPYRYFDPQGATIGGYLLGLGEILLGGTLIVSGGIVEIATFGAYTMGCGVQLAAGMSLICHGFSMTTYHAQNISIQRNSNIYPYNEIGTFNKRKGNERRAANESGAPPVKGEQLLGNGSTSPGQGFNEWRGKGPPGSKGGSWVRGSGKSIDSIHSDLDHPPPKGPHWDYHGPGFPNGARVYPDGTWEVK